MKEIDEFEEKLKRKDVEIWRAWGWVEKEERHGRSVRRLTYITLPLLPIRHSRYTTVNDNSSGARTTVCPETVHRMTIWGTIPVSRELSNTSLYIDSEAERATGSERKEEEEGGRNTGWIANALVK